MAPASRAFIWLWYLAWGVVSLCVGRYSYSSPVFEYYHLEKTIEIGPTSTGGNDDASDVNCTASQIPIACECNTDFSECDTAFFTTSGGNIVCRATNPQRSPGGVQAKLTCITDEGFTDVSTQLDFSHKSSSSSHDDESTCPPGFTVVSCSVGSHYSHQGQSYSYTVQNDLFLAKENNTCVLMQTDSVKWHVQAVCVAGKALHEACTPGDTGDKACHRWTPNSYCHDGISKCQCKHGFYQRGYDCVHVLHNSDYQCDQDIDCSVYVLGSVCNSTGACQCGEGWHRTHNDPKRWMEHYECEVCKCTCLIPKEKTGKCDIGYIDSEDCEFDIGYCSSSDMPRIEPNSLLNLDNAFRDNKGREFTLGLFDIPNDIRNIPETQPELHITTERPREVRVLVSCPLYDPETLHNVTVKRGHSTVVKLIPTIGLNSRHENKGISVKATDDISVYVVYVKKKQRSAGGYMAIPNDVLGTGYLVASFPFDETRGHLTGSAAGVIASQNDTTVYIRYPTKSELGHLGRNYQSFNLSAFETLLFSNLHGTQPMDLDLTGLYIVSNKPIAVISGAFTAVMDVEFPERREVDYMIEMMPPINALERQYIIPPGYIVKVIATQTDTVVDAYTADGREISTTLYDRGWFTYFDQGDDDIMVLDQSGTMKPLLVVFFTKSKQKIADPHGDVSMMVVPPIGQFPSNSSFVACSTLENKIHLLAHGKERPFMPPNKAAILNMDSLPLNQIHGDLKWRYQNATESFYGYMAMHARPFRIDSGGHLISNENPMETHLGLLIGTDEEMGLAYPTGWRFGVTHPCRPSFSIAGDLIDNDCDSFIDEEVFNGLDDDEDGLVDEDLAENRLTFPQTPPWEIICTELPLYNLRMISLVFNSGEVWYKVQPESFPECGLDKVYAEEWRQNIVVNLTEHSGRNMPCGVVHNAKEDGDIYSIDIVARKHPHLVTKFDKRYEVSCVFSNKDHLKNVIGTATEVTMGKHHGQYGDDENIYSDQAVVALSVTAGNSSQEKTEVVIGDRIRIKASLVQDGVYQGIRVTECIAETEFERSNPKYYPDEVVTLPNGCGVGQTKKFSLFNSTQGFMPMEDSPVEAYSPPFCAFMLEGYDTVVFKCTVELCSNPKDHYCTSNHCHPDNRPQPRLRRSSLTTEDVMEPQDHDEQVIAKTTLRIKKPRKQSKSTSQSAENQPGPPPVQNKPHSLPGHCDIRSPLFISIASSVAAVFLIMIIMNAILYRKIKLEEILLIKEQADSPMKT